jgi:hypothetical protein
MFGNSFGVVREIRAVDRDLNTHANEQGVCGEVEVLAFDEPVSSDAIEGDDRRNPPAGDDVIPRNFSASKRR